MAMAGRQVKNAPLLASSSKTREAKRVVVGSAPMETERYLVLSALGPDRPGLVADVTSYLTERGANIEDSRMAVLGAEFGILTLVSGGEASLGAIAAETEALTRKTGLVVITRPTKSPEEHRRAQVVPCIVTAEALDQEGIVRSISTALFAIGANIVTLETEAYPAPVSATPLFRLEARVDVPAGVTLGQVRKALEKVGQDENIDIAVRSGAAR